MKYKRDSVLIYESFWIAMCDLAAETQARLLKAIMEYGMYGKEPDLVGIEKSFFTLIRPQIDANNTRYWNRRGGKEPVETSQTGSYAQKSAQGMPSTAEVGDCMAEFASQQTTSSAQPQAPKCNYTPEYVEESGTFAIVNVQNCEACESAATVKNFANACENTLTAAKHMKDAESVPTPQTNEPAQNYATKDSQKSAQSTPSNAEASDCMAEFASQQTTSSAQPQAPKCNYTPEYVEESGTFAIVNVQNGEACEGNATTNAANAQGENCAQKPVANGQNTPKCAYGVGISRESACAEGRARSRVETDDKAECRQFANAKRESLQEFPSEYVPEYIEEKEFVAVQAPQPQVNKREQVCFPSDYVPEYVEEKEFEITQVYQEPNADSEPCTQSYTQQREPNANMPQKQGAYSQPQPNVHIQAQQRGGPQAPREPCANMRESRAQTYTQPWELNVNAPREPCANMRESRAQTHTQPWKQEAEYAEPATRDCATPRTRAAPKPRTKRFVPPTPQEVAEFCRANDIDVDAERFCCFYQSKGWQVGSSPMRDWQAAAKGWARSQRAAETVPKAIIGKPLDRRPYTDEELNALYTPLEE